MGCWTAKKNMTHQWEICYLSSKSLLEKWYFSWGGLDSGRRMRCGNLEGFHYEGEGNRLHSAASPFRGRALSFPWAVLQIDRFRGSRSTVNWLSQTSESVFSTEPLLMPAICLFFLSFLLHIFSPHVLLYLKVNPQIPSPLRNLPWSI